MVKKLVVLGVVLAASLGLGAGPAAADGPKNAKESAVCSQVLGALLPKVPLGAVCAVQGEDD
ncbi:hypothetical protein [Kitasatospora sp. MMS16-BH015]|uniref:hypothetical protein n=1 Tax=Kitasatospora sp. MMS16-BH015 TaxID=2018025 RepID=UPI000CF23D78|nr:hypothetical protein [Kitasatospora sp. MMS16-BH015]